MATTYDKASLVMIPSGYKDDKLYSVKPTDGSGDFTFSRDGSGASPATRVNASGYIEKGRENVLLQSNTFSTTWSTYNGTVTSGATDTNGGSNAWTLAKTGTYGDVGQVVSVTGVYTFSVYAKAGTLDHLQLSNSASPFMGVMFDLTNGTVASEANNIAAKVTDIGSGWYRCEAAVNQTASGEWRLQPADGVGGVPNANLGDVIIFQAQLEQGLVATDYIETTTAPVSAGLLGDMPRLDYSGGATCPSLLLEPSRVNLIPHSEYIGNWAPNGSATRTPNQAISPEGVQNAYLIEAQPTSFGYFLVPVGTTGVGDTYTYSIYAKIKSGSPSNIVRFGLGGGAFGGDKLSDFDLSSGTIVSSNPASDSVNIESVGDGWYRLIVTDTTIAASAIATPIYSSTSEVHFYAWGAQLEQASYPTSYIPTYGSASTRGADDAIVNYTDISNTGGTLFYQGFAEISSDSHLIALSDGAGATGTNRVLFYRSISDNKIWLYIQSAGVSVKNIALELPTDANDKLAVAWATNDFAVYINGVQEYTSSTGAIPTGMEYIQLNEWNNVHEEKNEIKQALYFPTRLTNAELAALTA